MFCSKCGAQLPDDSQFCGNCGTPVNAQQPNYAQAPQQPPQAPNFAQQQPQYDPNFAPQQAPYGFAPLGMKWYKFLIYFFLFAVAVINVFGGISALTGANYTYEGENISKLVYALYSDLKTVDIIYGIACILLGVYQVYVRFQLAKYKMNAPKALFGMYVANALIVAIYSFSVLGIVPTEVVSHSELTGQAIGAIAGAGVMIWLNKIYFDKRKNLFVNQ